MSEAAGDPIQDLRQAIDDFEKETSGSLSFEASRTGEPIGGPEDEARWRELDRCLKAPIAGQRVLLVGLDTEYDAAAFLARGAESVFACDRWQDLDPDRRGRFDIVHCRDLLHRVSAPLELLRTLRRTATPGAVLLLGSLILCDPERSECLRLLHVPGGGEFSWWFVPGRLAFRWMVQAAGFEIRTVFDEHDGPRGIIPTAVGYLEATAE